MLAANQFNILRTDLQNLAGIEYDDVLNELLDHYATLTEQRMATGLSFDEASKWAWAGLGSGIGIQAIQDDYIKNVQRQVRVEHLEILKSYFRWPTFVVTALVAALVYMVVPLLPENTVMASFWLIAITPTIILMWSHRKSVDRRTSSGPITLKYMQRSSGIFLNLTQIVLMYSGGTFLDQHEGGSLLQLYVSVSVTIGLLMTLYIVSFVQLFHQQFALKIA